MLPKWLGYGFYFMILNVLLLNFWNTFHVLTLNNILRQLPSFCTVKLLRYILIFCLQSSWTGRLTAVHVCANTFVHIQKFRGRTFKIIVIDLFIYPQNGKPYSDLCLYCFEEKKCQISTCPHNMLSFLLEEFHEDIGTYKSEFQMRVWLE